MTELDGLQDNIVVNLKDHHGDRNPILNSLTCEREGQHHRGPVTTPCRRCPPRPAVHINRRCQDMLGRHPTADMAHRTTAPSTMESLRHCHTSRAASTSKDPPDLLVKRSISNTMSTDPLPETIGAPPMPWKPPGTLRRDGTPKETGNAPLPLSLCPSALTARRSSGGKAEEGWRRRRVVATWSRVLPVSPTGREGWCWEESYMEIILYDLKSYIVIIDEL